MRKSSTQTRTSGRPLGGESRFHGDTGSVIAEAALLTPLFITLLFGVLEFGGAFRDYLTLGNGSLAGTRQAAIQGNAADADWNIVQAVKKSVSAMPLSQINKVVIFRLRPVLSSPGPGECLTSACPTSPVPSTCLSAIQGVANVCNVYGPTELAVISATVPATWNTCPGPPSQTYPASFYCPTTRNVLAPSPTNSAGPDYVGVYVEITHPWITGLFGSSIKMSDTSVTRLEPQKL